ncbi:MAG: AbrB/MazE/SpoVT family DNA-binding domain-containing protein [Methanoregula sp.]
MDVGITHVSSKGQIVIPSSMRNNLSEGEELLIIREGGRYILKPLDELKPALKDDIIFAGKTEEAFSEYLKGSFKRTDKDTFLDELASW